MRFGNGNGNGNGNGHPRRVRIKAAGGVVQGDVDEGTVLNPYPEDKYQAVLEGRVSTDDFIDDLVRHVREGLERAAPPEGSTPPAS